MHNHDISPTDSERYFSPEIILGTLIECGQYQHFTTHIILLYTTGRK